MELMIDAAVALTFEELSQITVAMRDRAVRLAVVFFLAACCAAAAAFCILYVCLEEKLSRLRCLDCLSPEFAALSLATPCQVHSASESAIRSVQRVWTRA